MDKTDWEKIVAYYTSVKEYYILCEETDPELKTNLQPLNEFRAALDHLMRIVAIENVNCSERKDANSDEECRKLLGHLKRAFYDICDMLSINYRNKIIDALSIYDSEMISKALPNYYSEIRPQINLFSEKIANLREEKGFGVSSPEDRMCEYKDIINSLREYYKRIQEAVPSLEELRKEKVKRKKYNWGIQVGIPAAGIIIGAVIAIIGWVM